MQEKLKKTQTYSNLVSKVNKELMLSIAYYVVKFCSLADLNKDLINKFPYFSLLEKHKDVLIAKILEVLKQNIKDQDVIKIFQVSSKLCFKLAFLGYDVSMTRSSSKFSLQ